jgi:hypothetical protein
VGTIGAGCWGYTEERAPSHHPGRPTRHFKPAVTDGGQFYCHYRKMWCRVTSWTDAPVPWPRGVPEGPGRKGHPGLIVTRALERAIRTESAAALMHWFGVGVSLAWRYRQWLGVEGWTRTPGSRRLQHEVSAKGAAGVRAKKWTDEELDRKAAAAKRCGTRPGERWGELRWTPDQEALLWTAPDEEVAGRIGRTTQAVRCRRTRAGIRTLLDRRYRVSDTR